MFGFLGVFFQNWPETLHDQHSAAHNYVADPHGNEVLNQACTEFVRGLVLSPVYINLRIKLVHFNLTLHLYWLNSRVFLSHE